jgi:alcohol dehydrogenase class IV
VELVTVLRFAFPTDIRFGAGALDELAGTLAELGVSRPLLVTDRGVAGLPLWGQVHAAAAAAGAAVSGFGEVHGNPTQTQVVAGVASYRAHGADGVVALGGGAAIDVAKAVALMASHPGSLFDYEDEVPGARPVTDAVPPIVAIPTTAGTGSEVGRSAVISDDVTHVKRIVFSPHLLPRVVLADPQLTVGLPAPVTAATGMDAVTHNVEAFLTPAFHPICDGIALEGLRLAFGALPVAVAEPSDLGARGDMLMASMMGAIAFQKGLGVVHSCAHALGTVADLHHGLANAVMIDHALVLNVPVARDKFVRMARAVELDDERPEAFLAALAALKQQVGLPAGLAAAGIGSSSLGDLVQVAAADGCHLNNPVAVSSGDFDAIFSRAMA